MLLLSAFTQVFDNTYLNMEFTIPRDVDRPDFDKGAKRLRDKDRLPIFRAHNNTIMDTIMYDLEYKYGHKSLLVVNAISENMFNQVNREGNWHVLFQEIIDHRYNGTKAKEQDAFITTRNRTNIRRETT